MVAIEGIQDRDSFKEWLDETNQPREACVALAARAALRVLPLHWSRAATSESFLALPFFRANLIASVAGLAPSELLKEPKFASALRTAAANAADIARANGAEPAGYAAQVADTAAYAARAADAADNITSTYGAHAAVVSNGGMAMQHAVKMEAWAAIRSDCIILAGNGDLSHLPLFALEPPEWFNHRLALVSSAATADWSFDWSFWLDWYQRLLDGREQNWPLLLEISTQDNAFWKGSDAEVNAGIAKIVERHRSNTDLSDETLADAAEAYPLGETITRDDQARYVVIADAPTIPEDAFELAKRRARDAVDDMRDDVRESNKLRGMERTRRKVERELERSADASVLVYEALVRAVVDLQTLSQTDDLVRGDPVAEETVQQYHDRFLESAVELRVHDPSVRANHDAKAPLKDKPFPLPPSETEKLRAIGQFVHDNAAGVLAEQMPEDAELATDPQEPEENRKSALLRLAGRVVRIFIVDRKSVHDMAAAATLIEFVRAQGLIDTVAALVRMLLSLI